MGTWGSGNFDNDAASDWLREEVQAPLIKTIEDIIVNPKFCEWDNAGEAELMPAIHVLALLNEQFGGTEPDAATAKRRKKTYLIIFDQSFHKSGAKVSFIAERRAVIVSTFDKLIQLSAEADARYDELKDKFGAE